MAAGTVIHAVGTVPVGLRQRFITVTGKSVQKTTDPNMTIQRDLFLLTYYVPDGVAGDGSWRHRMMSERTVPENTHQP